MSINSYSYKIDQTPKESQRNNEVWQFNRNQNYQKRPKVPIFFKYSLRQDQPEQNIMKKENEMYKFSPRQFSILKINCQLCQYPYYQDHLVSLSKCQHKFCLLCLHKYVNYKISVYQQVLCPQQTCDRKIDQNSKIYLQLPQKSKQKYKTVKLWRQTFDNPNLRLCPRQNCQEGLIDLLKNPPQCRKCHKTYCKSCQLQTHQGSCQKNFQNVFNQWKKCPHCGMLIEKIQGCNHITCICKKQFCFVCGKNWRGYSHQYCTNQARYRNHVQRQILNERTCLFFIKKIIFLLLGLILTIILLPILLILAIVQQILNWVQRPQHQTQYTFFRTMVYPIIRMNDLSSIPQPQPRQIPYLRRR